MICAISDDECLGRVSPYDMDDGPLPLCEFHERVLCNELGQDGFREWYSEEIEAAKGIEAQRAATVKQGAVHESPAPERSSPND